MEQVYPIPTTPNLIPHRVSAFLDKTRNVIQKRGGGGVGTSAYTVSKHGVVGLTKTAAIEYGKAGTLINAVCPGAIYTPMMERLQARDPEGETNTTVEQSPAGRMADAKEVDEAVVWLCSKAVSFVTGAVLPVDGGHVARSRA